jgi:hypothetical protein
MDEEQPFISPYPSSDGVIAFGCIKRFASPAVEGAKQSPESLIFGTRRAFSPVVEKGEEYFGGCMAKLIKFYIPQRFRGASKWLPPKERGKLLEFPVMARKSA